MTDSDMRRLLARKRDGGALAPGEWADCVAGYLAGALDESQFAALLMATTLRGMDEKETIELTRAMVNSGETLQYDRHPIIDKHSSGGVGDTTSLVAVPWAAAGGVRIAKLAGRALGHTGGTIDKLEAIPGVRTDLSVQEFTLQVATVGCAISAQSATLVPADKKIYALRDRTATVPSIGLIAASIVSKKIAAGADAIVYDVKVGRGAFMRTLADARELAERIIAVTKAFKKRCRVIISDMDEPLGRCIGDGLEVKEAFAILDGSRSLKERLPRLSRYLAQAMADIQEQPIVLESLLTSGAALAKLQEMLRAQGADLHAFAAQAPLARQSILLAPSSGYVTSIHPVKIGEAARSLREQLGVFAGFELHVEVGSQVEKGQPVVTVWGDDSWDIASLGIEFSREAPVPRPLVYLDLQDDLGMLAG